MYINDVANEERGRVGVKYGSKKTWLSFGIVSSSFSSISSSISSFFHYLLAPNEYKIKGDRLGDVNDINDVGNEESGWVGAEMGKIFPTD